MFSRRKGSLQSLVQDSESSSKTVHLWPEEIFILSFPTSAIKGFLWGPRTLSKTSVPTDIHSNLSLRLKQGGSCHQQRAKRPTWASASLKMVTEQLLNYQCFVTSIPLYSRWGAAYFQDLKICETHWKLWIKILKISRFKARQDGGMNCSSTLLWIEGTPVIHRGACCTHLFCRVSEVMRNYNLRSHNQLSCQIWNN